MCVVQSIAKKDGDFETHNQDFVHATLLAISDGAGGTGFFASDWAKYLCMQLPTTPFEVKEEMVSWFNDIRSFFFNEKRNEVAQDFPEIKEDYDREGSSATLLAAWPLPDDRLRVVSYGDSVAFLFGSDGKLKQRTISSLLVFTEDPYLLHSNEPMYPDPLTLDTWPVSEGDCLVMASDALSQWILIQYALHNSEVAHELDQVLGTPHGLGNHIIRCQTAHDGSTDFQQVLQQLQIACQDQVTFRNYTNSLFQKGQLALDDYTLRICSPIPTSLKP